MFFFPHMHMQHVNHIQPFSLRSINSIWRSADGAAYLVPICELLSVRLGPGVSRASCRGACVISACAQRSGGQRRPGQSLCCYRQHGGAGKRRRHWDLTFLIIVMKEQQADVHI